MLSNTQHIVYYNNNQYNLSDNSIDIFNRLSNNDKDVMGVSDSGDIFMPFEISELSNLVDTEIYYDTPTNITYLDNGLPLLHTDKNNPKKIYLNFEEWENDDSNAWPYFNAKPYTLDSSFNFSNIEVENIIDIWKRVVENFYIFNVDVTTERPSVFTEWTQHSLITSNIQINNDYMPYSYVAGIAYVNIYGRNRNNRYSPALTYHTVSLNNAYIASVITHEAGHNFGLLHDGTNNVAYYRGEGNNDEKVAWAPIMGVPRFRSMNIWSKGEYNNANNLEDDISIIGNLLDFKPLNHSLIMITPNHTYYGYVYNNISTNTYLLNLDYDANVTLSCITYGSNLDDPGNLLDIGIKIYDNSTNFVTKLGLNTEVNIFETIELLKGNYSIYLYGESSKYYSDYSSFGKYKFQTNVIYNKSSDNYSLTSSNTTNKGRFYIRVYYTCYNATSIKLKLYYKLLAENSTSPIDYRIIIKQKKPTKKWFRRREVLKITSNFEYNEIILVNEPIRLFIRNPSRELYQLYYGVECIN